jgi:hypothetical protein
VSAASLGKALPKRKKAANHQMSMISFSPIFYFSIPNNVSYPQLHVCFTSPGFKPGPASQNQQQAQTRLAVVGRGSGADTDTATVHGEMCVFRRDIEPLND